MRLLEGGNEVNGGWDRLPFAGANLGPDDIDVNSFRRHTALPGMDRWTLRIPDGAKLRDTIEPVLLTTRTVIDQRIDEEGRCRVVRYSSGLENKVETVLDLSDADFALQPLPKSDRDDALINRLVLKLDWDEGEDTSHLSVEFNDQASIAAFGETRQQRVDLRGLTRPEVTGAQADALLQPFAAQLFALLAEPRRLFRFTVSTGKGLFLHPGQVITIESAVLQGYGSARGLNNVAARVLEVRTKLLDEGAEVVAVFYDMNATGWGPACQVTSAPTSTSVVVASNAYSDARDPHTGLAQVDLDGFQVGDTVRCVPRGDHDAAAVVVVTGIDAATGTMSFDGPHGLRAPRYGDVEPTVYDEAAAHHRVWAYWTDENGTLGTSDAEGGRVV